MTDDAELATLDTTQDLRDVAPTVQTIQMIAHVAPEFIPNDLAERPGAVIAMVLSGRELGLSPMESLRNMYVVDGHVGLSAELQVALARRAGHAIWVEDQVPNQYCTVAGRRSDDPPDVTHRVSFTIDQAVAAGLVEVDGNGKPRKRSQRGRPMPWETYTDDLLYARAVGRLIRRMCPDAVIGAERGVQAAVDVVGEVTTPAAVSEPTPLPAPPDRRTLIDLVSEPATGTGPQIEARLRAMCRAAEAHGLVAAGYLHTRLANYGAAHVSDLRKAELEAFTNEVVRAEILEALVAKGETDDVEAVEAEVVAEQDPDEPVPAPPDPVEEEPPAAARDEPAAAPPTGASIDYLAYPTASDLRAAVMGLPSAEATAVARTLLTEQPVESAKMQLHQWWVRALFYAMERGGLWRAFQDEDGRLDEDGYPTLIDPLHKALQSVGANHVDDLRRDDLIEFVTRAAELAAAKFEDDQ